MPSENSNTNYDPYQESLMQEECILVDDNDKAIGHATKRTCHTIDPNTGKSPLHRAFSLFIFNRDNKLLLQQRYISQNSSTWYDCKIWFQLNKVKSVTLYINNFYCRSDTKITFPGLWTNSCCSHPLATFQNEQNLPDEKDGMGAKRAAQRRIFDELGIPSEQCPVEQMVYLTRILYNSPSCGKWGEHELDYILFFKDYNNDIIPRPNPNEIKVIISFNLSYEIFYLDQEQNYLSKIGN